MAQSWESQSGPQGDFGTLLTSSAPLRPSFTGGTRGNNHRELSIPEPQAGVRLTPNEGKT